MSGDSKYATWLERPPLIVATQLAQQGDVRETAGFFAYVLKNSPAQKLTAWCDWLLCSPIYADRSNVHQNPSQYLAGLGNDEQKELCGHCFLEGEIVWNCRTCQVDDTCVLCEKCFKDGDHRGHDVYFHRTRAGGCCDCGDPEAWNPKGFCSKHGYRETAEQRLPQAVEAIARAVIPHVYFYLEETVRVKFASHEIEEVNTHYSLATSTPPTIRSV
jgi:hypothetical protein